MSSVPLPTNLQLLTLLRFTPLLSSTASLAHAYMERVTTTCFLSQAPTTSPLSRSVLKGQTPTSPHLPQNIAAVSAAKEIVIPVWWVNFFDTAVWSVIGLNLLTLTSASANVFLFGEKLGTLKNFFFSGLLAAGGHYGFVPMVSTIVKRLYLMCVKGEKGDEVGKGISAVGCVREWLGVHKIGMGTVDLVAWGSFWVGVVGVLGK